MKKHFKYLVLGLVALGCLVAATTDVVTVMATRDGTLRSPTNFFNANQAALINTVKSITNGIGGGVASNAVSQLYSNTTLVGSDITKLSFKYDGTSFLVASNSGVVTVTIPTNASVDLSGLQAGSSNLTNWSYIGTNLVVYVTQLTNITNGFAYSTNLPTLTAGANITITTNVVGSQTNYTVAYLQTVYSVIEGYGMTFSTNLAVVTADVNTNIIATRDFVTNYVDTVSNVLASAGGGTTNFPQIAITNGVDLLTNAPLRLYGSGYGDLSNYKLGQIQQNANSLDIGTYALGTGAATSNGMALNLATWGTNRWYIDPIGNYIPLGDYNIGSPSDAVRTNYADFIKIVNGGNIGSVSGTYSITGAGNYDSAGYVRIGAAQDFGWTLRAYIFSPAEGRITLNGYRSSAMAPLRSLTFGPESSTNASICLTNQGIIQITHGGDLTGTNTVGGAKFDIINKANIIYGTTTITNLDSTFPRIANLRIADASQSFSVTNTTYRRITNWVENVANGCTVAMTNGYITNDIAGYYQVQIGMSFSGPAAARTYRAIIQTNDTATSIAWQREISSVMTGDANAFGQLYLPAGTAISYAIKQDTSEDNIAIKEARFTVQKCQ